MKHIKAFEKRINGVKTKTWLRDGAIIDRKLGLLLNHS